MALRKIVEVGEDCLTRVCRPVTDFNPRLCQLLDDMAETLAEAGGAGLAAPQVGVLRRACLVLDEETEEYLELINPEIIARAASKRGWRAASASPASGASSRGPTWCGCGPRTGRATGSRPRARG